MIKLSITVWFYSKIFNTLDLQIWVIMPMVKVKIYCNGDVTNNFILAYSNCKIAMQIHI